MKEVSIQVTQHNASRKSVNNTSHTVKLHEDSFRQDHMVREERHIESEDSNQQDIVMSSVGFEK
jgi:hypothetical protein